MKITIGLVGAEDSVNMINEVALEYSEKIECITLPYQDKKDTIEIVGKNIDKVDVIVFSGRVPYNIAVNNIMINIPCLYVPHKGTCVYKALWEIKEEGIDITNISFDTVNTQEVEEVLEELGFHNNGIYTWEYPGDISYDELAQYHYKLWQEGKIKAAVTCLWSTYDKLKKLGVPAFRATLTKSLIRQTIENAIHEGNAKRLKANQIAVLLVNIDNFRELIKKYPSEYQIQKLKIKLYDILLNYGQLTHGSVFSFGGDEYLIFTTRGALEQATDGYRNSPLLNSVREQLDISISCGVGFGKTAYGAETNARIGLQHAKDNGGDCAFMVTDDNSIIGPIGKDNTLEYSLNNTDHETLEISERVGISAAYISKLRSVINQLGDNVINSKDMAYYLNITERSARRILAMLCDSGCAQEIGEESHSTKGRPRKSYRLMI